MSEELEPLKNELRERIVQGLLKGWNFVTMRETHELYVYDNGVYKLGVAESEINKTAENAMNKDGTRYDVNEIIFHVKCRTYQDWNFWEIEDKFLCLSNGILNVEFLMLQPPEGLRQLEHLMALQSHSPEFHFLNKLPVEYKTKEELANVEDLITPFFRSIVASEDVDALFEFFGYCLLRRMPIHKAFMLVGKGENGKSTLLSLLKAFLGSDNVSNQTLQSICENRFAAVELHGKLANIYADLEQKSLYNTGMFKILSGEDTIDAERKFVQRRIKFTNFAKQIYSCNVIPANERDDTVAFWRRWMLITFPNRFSKELGNVDPNILQKLTTREQLSILLLKSLEGLKRLLQNHSFSNQKTTDETRLDYIVRSDPIKYFAEMHLEQDSENFAPKITVYEAYKTFCRERRLEVKDSNIFGRILRKYLTYSDTQKTIDGKHGVTCYSGIKLKTETPMEKQPEITIFSP